MAEKTYELKRPEDEEGIREIFKRIVGDNLHVEYLGPDNYCTSIDAGWLSTGEIDNGKTNNTSEKFSVTDTLPHESLKNFYKKALDHCAKGPDHYIYVADGPTTRKKKFSMAVLMENLDKVVVHEWTPDPR